MANVDIKKVIGNHKAPLARALCPHQSTHFPTQRPVGGSKLKYRSSDRLLLLVATLPRPQCFDVETVPDATFVAKPAGDGINPFQSPKTADHVLTTLNYP
jgi:hypothetical protein